MFTAFALPLVERQSAKKKSTRSELVRLKPSDAHCAACGGLTYLSAWGGRRTRHSYVCRHCAALPKLTVVADLEIGEPKPLPLPQAPPRPQPLPATAPPLRLVPALTVSAIPPIAPIAPIAPPIAPKPAPKLWLIKPTQAVSKTKLVKSPAPAMPKPSPTPPPTRVLGPFNQMSLLREVWHEFLKAAHDLPRFEENPSCAGSCTGRWRPAH